MTSCVFIVVWSPNHFYFNTGGLFSSIRFFLASSAPTASPIAGYSAIGEAVLNRFFTGIWQDRANIFQCLLRQLRKQSHRTLLRIIFAQSDLTKTGKQAAILLSAAFCQLIPLLGQAKGFVRFLLQQALSAHHRKHLAYRCAGNAQTNRNINAAHPLRFFFQFKNGEQIP